MRHLERLVSISVFIIVLLFFFLALSANSLIVVQAASNPIHLVMGNSMAPTINSNDGVIIKPLDGGKAEPGMVVVFPDPLHESQYIVHRIIDIKTLGEETYVVTKGDNNPEADPFLTLVEELEGEVILRIPDAGVYLDFIYTRYGYFTTVILPVAVLALYVFAKWREAKLAEKGSQSLLFSMDLFPT